MTHVIVFVFAGLALVPTMAGAQSLPQPTAEPGAIILPAPSATPQTIARGDDRFLAALATRGQTAEFDARMRAAIEALPALGEGTQSIEALREARNQARSRLFPALGLDLVGSRTIIRDLQLPTTQVENLSPRSRNDVLGSVDQLLYDFGGTSARIRSGNASVDAARADLDTARNDAILQLVTAWYDVLEARTGVALVGANVARLASLAEGAELRFQRGVDSGGDVARARSYLAAAQSQQVGFQRQLANAESRYFEIFGTAPGAVARPVAPEGPGGTPITDRPEVVAARAEQRAAAAAADAARADRLPRLDARIGTNAYDVTRGSAPAYDIRAQITLRTRFSAGGAEAARVRELRARERVAGFAVDRIEAATTRDTRVAEADVAGLAASLPPLEAAYLDSRRARDLYVEQFRVSRGILFDVLRAERDLLEAALSLARTTYDLDVARFTLLARQNGVIGRFGLTPAANPVTPQEKSR